MRELIPSILKLLATLALGSTVFLTATAQSSDENSGVAIFAGGCFWCVESDFDHVPGVLETTSGYIGGSTANPSYESVTRGNSGHREAVEIRFDPQVVSYAELVEVFWRSVDPTDGGGQFCDRGYSYTTAIFALDREQAAIASKSKAALETSGKLKAEIATTVEPAGTFYAAEGYHQDYYERNSLRYKWYRFSCGRDARIRELWGQEAHRGIERPG